ncbi:Pentatricopeptide repeat superfamily protein [Perilla frutescens var. hirtella]|nr:Pentatricopeptide repeat superfamily protein [Perilla frutescens var. hirtella]
MREGKLVHLHLKQTGSKHPNTFFANHLIGIYVKYGDHLNSREAFDKMLVRNLYSWNNMLSGDAESCGEGVRAVMASKAEMEGSRAFPDLCDCKDDPCCCREDSEAFLV